MIKRQVLGLVDPAVVPSGVLIASSLDWGVTVDAYLIDAARMGGRYAAQAYLDRSGEIRDGMTVVTPEVTQISRKGGFLMVRSLSQKDHYVIVTEQS
ncbi:hypothetical protein ALO95_200356 [Pseudomonas syringae pv. antirrhini]|uniref:Uncharacterized protein n=1 Tax=Pseudomonas syringae pv. antirrhini TaxID=251702 RepID=A0A0P9P7E4_9PSED|nr:MULTISPECIES: hypothetical protein [Pseudomonas]KPW52717.1 Uncharacterized protein ALO88_00010 [Pseudomonas syringae pv. antirrhini]RMP32128.1 hypothetical protein ALQ24_03180 [Pseudomonas syringae pv. antirrhini]RMP42527.1 hypothetical protein ALQ23_200090 [Pseudomonas syringae pv. antirrhini]RMW23436.1 hypothetical protein ALO95_200356 [Pseudomonas syringae pv. antirrhini]WIN08853.1 hypothetical protein QQF68_08430 [Pseudomonas syringae pv. antirrhini str. 126]